MKNVVSIVDGELRLCSGLGEYAFGKTNYNSILNRKGLLAQCDNPSEDKLHFSFTDWTFEDIKSFDIEGKDEAVVFYCAKNPLSKDAESLLQLFEKAGSPDSSIQDKDKMFNAAYSVCCILTQLAEEEKELYLTGAGGILVDGDKLLFLPGELFKNSIAGFSSLEQADLHNCWINPSLTGLPALCFARSSFAYKMLTGRFAYPASDNTSRNADLLDRNFLPLELCINGVDQEVAKAVNKGLKLNSNSVEIPGKKAKGKKSEELIPEIAFPLEKLKRAKENISSKMSDEEFENKVNAFTRHQNSKVKTKRTLRRNATAFTAGIIIFIAILLMIRSTYNNYLDDYTTKGLTSVQTIQTFFKGMNNQDVPLIQTFIKGRSASRYLDSLSNVFVISKQRQTAANDSGYLKPAKFFLTVTSRSKLSTAGLYGVTNILIDGIPYDEYIELPKNKDNPQPLSQEKGVTINKGDISVHNVEYYLLHTEGTDADYYITKNKDIFTLTFMKGKWIITSIENTEIPVEIDSDAFKNDFFNRILVNEGDAVKTVKELSLTYDFLPSQKEMQTEKKIRDEYLADPFKDLF